MINIIGLGYIGLPTALIFSQTGLKVVGTDINKKLVEKLSSGNLNSDEMGMSTLFHKALDNDIEFSTEYVKTNRYIITVPTPYNNDNKSIDISYITSAMASILAVCDTETIVVIESTISPGTIDKHIRPIINSYEKEYKKKIHIAHAPERIIPGNILFELVHNSRTIGVDDEIIGNEIKQLYAKFCKADIIITDIKTAEMSKVVENTYRDINIAFANELAKICNEDNLDVYEIIDLANKHPRVNILKPGPGVGGHCIPVDPWFLVSDYPHQTNLIRTAREVNSSMPEYVLDRIIRIMHENNINDFSEIGLYGLTYKENVPDTRESPTVQLLDEMEKRGIEGVYVYDPIVKEKLTKNQTYDYKYFFSKIKLIVVMVGHDHILHENLENKIIFDTKNIINISRKYLI